MLVAVIANILTRAFFAILTLSIPTPVMARYEFGSETWYQSMIAADIVLLLCWRSKSIEDYDEKDGVNERSPVRPP